MREIKFRAWIEESKSMEVGLFGLRSDGKPSFNKDAILLQFTGLKDKNGIDIYEGDILITKYQDKAKMIWHNEFACFCYETIDEIIKEDYQFTFKDVEVEIIGNIYEKPELL